MRQAISYGIDRAHLLTDNGGPTQGVALTHVLPAGINGSQDVLHELQPVLPTTSTKAKQMLAAAAGYKSGLNVTLLYRAYQHGREQDGADPAE